MAWALQCPLCSTTLGCVGKGEGRGGERGKVRLQRLLCQSTTCCPDESTLVSKARGPEDAKQKSGGVPSSWRTKVKALGFLWLGLCNALCGRPLWVVWGGGKGEGEGARSDFKDCSVRAQPVVQMKALWSARQEDQKVQHKRVAGFHHLCSQKSRPWASYGLDFAMPSVLDHFGLCGEGGGERGREGQGQTSTTALSEHSLLYT